MSADLRRTTPVLLRSQGLEVEVERARETTPGVSNREGLSAKPTETEEKRITRNPLRRKLNFVLLINVTNHSREGIDGRRRFLNDWTPKNLNVLDG